MKTILLTALGNPGKKFEKTRHNAGFAFADYFFGKFRAEFNFSDWELKKKLDAEISVGNASGKKVILMKPQTFMNLSGEAVLAAKKYFKVRLADIFVVHDEIDLSLGKYKFSAGSSSAGHNGAQNIIDQLRTKNFTRIRIGIENRDDKKKIPTEKYVLGKFTDKELKPLRYIFEEVANELGSKLKAQS